MTTPLLEMTSISKRYPGVVALDDVSLEVFPGEIVALIGENGAGKSTLMKILGGVTARDVGLVRLGGAEVEIRSPIEASRLGIEFIHQELSVLDNLDVAANIFLRREPVTAGFLKLIDRKRIYADADEQLRRVGLALPSRTPLSQLSIAQQQQVEIARALSAGARILIMDEPTSSLSQSETDRLYEVIDDLARTGVAVVYISHRLAEVKRLAHRVTVLRDGQTKTLMGTGLRGLIRGYLGGDPLGVTGEHGGLADVVQTQVQHHHPLHTDTATSVRRAPVAERVDVSSDLLKI